MSFVSPRPSLFPMGQSLSVLLYSKLEKTAKKSFALRRLAHNICRGFKEHGPITRKSKVYGVVTEF